MFIMFIMSHLLEQGLIEWSFFFMFLTTVLLEATKGSNPEDEEEESEFDCLSDDGPFDEHYGCPSEAQ